MFREIRNGIVKSSDGFTVNDHGHFETLYIEGDHTAKFYKEPGVGAYIHYLDGPVRWGPPFEHEMISAERQEQIKDRVVAALTFRGRPLNIVR